MFRFTSFAFSKLKFQPVNCVNLVGVAHDIQAGYVGADLVLQFQLVCNYLPIANEAPLINPLSHASSGGDSSSENNNIAIPHQLPREREYFTIRATGHLDDIKTQLHDGSVVSLQGQFRTNVQQEPLADHKLIPFPFIAVKLSSPDATPGTDFIEILHGRGAPQPQQQLSKGGKK